MSNMVPRVIIQMMEDRIFSAILKFSETSRGPKVPKTIDDP